MKSFSVCIATPSLRATTTTTYVQSISSLQSACHTKGWGFDLRIITGISVIDDARNILVASFLEETDCSHLLFVDDDMGFNVTDMVLMLEFGRTADVIAAMYPKRNFNWARVKQIVQSHPDIDPAHIPNIAGEYERMFVLPDDSDTFTIKRAPIPVLAIGTGLMLISRRCLEHLRETASLLPYYIAGKTSPVYPFFRSQPSMGEDFAFCNLVRQHGCTLFGAPWLTVTHSGTYNYIGDLPGIARYNSNTKT